MSRWTLFSNHGHVLLYLSRDPDARLRDVASAVGITERAVQKIVRDLQDGGFLSVSKQGRRNRYRIHGEKSLRHPLEAHCSAGQLVDLIAGRVAPEETEAQVSEARRSADTAVGSPSESGAAQQPSEEHKRGEQGSLF